MKNTLLFAVTVVLLACFAGVALSWLSHLPVIQAVLPGAASLLGAGELIANTGQAAQPERTLGVWFTVAVLAGLFFILSITPLFDEEQQSQ